MSEKKTVAVIGGGAAGLMACGTAAKYADKVVLIEKNNILAKKVRITGKGRCNITNSADVEDIIRNIPTNGKFLYSALYSFTNEDTIAFFENLGVKTKIERGGRIFPVSDSAKDVAEALAKYAMQKNVKRIYAEAVGIKTENSKVFGVETTKGFVRADKVILASGGKSYPLTGSDGSGYKMAKRLGHTVIEPYPSLVPIETKENWVKDVMGLSLKNVSLKLYSKKLVYEDFGEMIFTHFGISGPIVLSASAHIKNTDKIDYFVKIDLKPALSEEQLDKRIQRDFLEFKKKHFINSLDELLPKALIPIIIELSGIEPHKETSSVTKEERKHLCELIKGLPLSVKRLRDISEAIITSGGIKVNEIDPSTMQSKLIEGLYFAGEIIDVDAYTGGFNLQIAFSTGHLAGESI